MFVCRCVGKTFPYVYIYLFSYAKSKCQFIIFPGENILYYSHRLHFDSLSFQFFFSTSFFSFSFTLLDWWRFGLACTHFHFRYLFSQSVSLSLAQYFAASLPTTHSIDTTTSAGGGGVFLHINLGHVSVVIFF